MIEVPFFVRVEYLTPAGWHCGLCTTNLLYPQKFIDRLQEKGKYGRVLELDMHMKPTGKVWVADNLPDPKDLVDSETLIPHLGNRPNSQIMECSLCGKKHKREWECVL